MKMSWRFRKNALFCPNYFVNKTKKNLKYFGGVRVFSPSSIGTHPSQNTSLLVVLLLIISLTISVIWSMRMTVHSVWNTMSSPTRVSYSSMYREFILQIHIVIFCTSKLYVSIVNIDQYIIHLHSSFGLLPTLCTHIKTTHSIP